MEIVLDYVRLISWESIFTTAFNILLILICGWIASLVIGYITRRMEQRLLAKTRAPDEGPSEASKRVETLSRLVRQAAMIVLWVSVLLVVLTEVGVAIGPILASVGVLGLAVGFGAQNLVRDIISGFFFIMENQVRVGDVAIVNGTGGVVERLNFRTIVLRDLAGTVHVFPNGTVDTLANMTRDWSGYVIDLGVAYKEDTDVVIEHMQAVGKELQEDATFGPQIIDELEIFGVNELADSAVIIKGRIKTKPGNQWGVGREYLRRIKKRFDAHGIEIPFPHQSLYIGEASKPLAVQVLDASAQSAGS